MIYCCPYGRSRASLPGDRANPWTNTFHVQQQHPRREDDSGGFINSSRGNYNTKRDSITSRDRGIVPPITNHVSNRDLTATPSSAITANSLPRSNTAHDTLDSNYTPRSYTPRADPLSTNSLRGSNRSTHATTGSSLTRPLSGKMEGVLPRSHTNLDSVGRNSAAMSVTNHMPTSASLPRAAVPGVGLVINGGSNPAPLTNGK